MNANNLTVTSTIQLLVTAGAHLTEKINLKRNNNRVEFDKKLGLLMGSLVYEKCNNNESIMIAGRVISTYCSNTTRGTIGISDKSTAKTIFKLSSLVLDCHHSPPRLPPRLHSTHLRNLHLRDQCICGTLHVARHLWDDC